MTKTAVFVEGQTELIFVREYFLKYFDYQDVAVACYTLFTDASHVPTEYAFPNPSASNYFEIINVGMDGSVLTRLLRREKLLWAAGFHRIIGLRDMYSKDYRSIVKDIDATTIHLFIEGHRKQIDSSAIQPSNIGFHFAIMETEAWVLGLYNCFVHLDRRLTPSFLSHHFGRDVSTIDPETTWFHPANELKKLYGLVGRNYHKSKSDVNAILGKASKEDFAALFESTHCQSFTEFSHSALKP